jgi:hypothetical protein
MTDGWRQLFHQFLGLLPSFCGSSAGLGFFFSILMDSFLNIVQLFLHFTGNKRSFLSGGFSHSKGMKSEKQWEDNKTSLCILNKWLLDMGSLGQL